MILEKIDYLDSLNLMSLTISGERFLISYELFTSLDLSLEEEVASETYKKILSEDEYNRAKKYALDQLSYSQKSSYDLTKKLKKKGFSQEAIERVLAFLENYSYLDDEAYVKAYINDKFTLSKWSKKKIAYSLRGKNIPDDLIEKYLAEIPDQEEYDHALYFAQKKAGGDFSQKSRQKVYSHLAYKGYSYDIISACLEEVFR